MIIITSAEESGKLVYIKLMNINPVQARGFSKKVLSITRRAFEVIL